MMKRIVLGLLLGAMVMTTGCIGGMGAAGEGEHVGYITAVETSGVVWQTAQLYFKTDLESTQEDLYCVDKNADNYEELLEKFKTFADENTRVRLSFESEIIVASWRCNTNVIALDAVPTQSQPNK